MRTYVHGYFLAELADLTAELLRHLFACLVVAEPDRLELEAGRTWLLLYCLTYELLLPSVSRQGCSIVELHLVLDKTDSRISFSLSVTLLDLAYMQTPFADCPE